MDSNSGESSLKGKCDVTGARGESEMRLVAVVGSWEPNARKL